MVPYTRLLTGRSTVVGKVRVPLQPVPESLANLDCRNNRLLATALVQIAPAVAELRETLGPERIAVVIGTSTSGIAEGEDAIEALTTTGRMPSTFHYARQEIGMASEFVARYSASRACASRCRRRARRRRTRSRPRGGCSRRVVATPPSSAARIASAA